jgi:hypothetical protein
MGHLAQVFRLSGSTHGRPPYSFPPSPLYAVPVVPDIVNLVGSLLSMLCLCCMGDVQIVETHGPCLGHIFTRSGLKGTLGIVP